MHRLLNVHVGLEHQFGRKAVWQRHGVRRNDHEEDGAKHRPRLSLSEGEKHSAIRLRSYSSTRKKKEEKRKESKIFRDFESRAKNNSVVMICCVVLIRYEEADAL